MTSFFQDCEAISDLCRKTKKPLKVMNLTFRGSSLTGLKNGSRGEI